VVRKIAVYTFRVISTIALAANVFFLLLMMILIDEIRTDQFDSTFDVLLIIIGIVCLSYALYTIDPKYVLPLNYNSVEEKVHARLHERGYLIIDEQLYTKKMPVRYTIWANQHKAIRLQWNGTQKWFTLEVAADLPLTAATQWNNLFTVPYNPNKHTSAYLRSISDGLVSSLPGIGS
jgi:hypothetical protein